VENGGEKGGFITVSMQKRLKSWKREGPPRNLGGKNIRVDGERNWNHSEQRDTESRRGQKRGKIGGRGENDFNKSRREEREGWAKTPD